MSRMRAACRRKTRSLFENKESQKICGFSGFQFSRKVTERAHPAPLRGAAAAAAEGPINRRSEKMRLAKRLAFFRFDFCFGVTRGEQPLVRGSSASKSPCPCRAKHAAFASQTGLRLKSPTGAFMPSGHRRPFWFSFGVKREQSPPGCSASKSPCPCRAEHTAFASQTGLRLKSPTGAFMTSGHRRPFWFSFGAKREHPLSKPLSPAAPPPPAGPARPAGRRPAAPRSRSAPRRCRAAHAEPARPQRPLPAP